VTAIDAQQPPSAVCRATESAGKFRVAEHEIVTMAHRPAGQ